MVKAVVFDRDGTLVKYGAYLYKPEDMVIYSGVFDACRLLQDHGIHLFIATNQSGIARGYFSEQDYLAVQNYIERLFASNGIDIQKTYYCPFHPVHGIGQYKKESNDRKPNPGMIQSIMNDFNFLPHDVVMVGDSTVDVEAAKNAGVSSALVRTGNGVETESKLTFQPSYIGDDVNDVVLNYILKP